MSDKSEFDLPFDSDDANEQKLWRALKNLPREEPSQEMRRSFYRELDRRSGSGFAEQVRGWLGLTGNSGWLTAAACVLVGIGIGQTLSNSESTAPSRLAALEQNVAMLNRELISQTSESHGRRCFLVVVPLAKEFDKGIEKFRAAENANVG